MGNADTVQGVRITIVHGIFDIQGDDISSFALLKSMLLKQEEFGYYLYNFSLKK